MESIGQVQPRSTSLQDLIWAALLARGNIMFSGKSGAPVASGIKGDAATAVQPSYGLVCAAIEVVFKELNHPHYCTPATAVCSAPAVAGCLLQWGHGAPR